jgi:signal transduction histidine kinase
MLYSALLIHLTGGRIETHFHVFGSLAILAFYRDWRVFIPATVVIAADHLIRGIFWPESVFGVLVASPWRAFEHAGWVVFEDVFLIWGCVTTVREMQQSAAAHADLQASRLAVEEIVEFRTRELKERTQSLEAEVNRSKTLELQLLQAQKLESIGQLAAGLAHEINTPMQFVSDNIEYLNECTDQLFKVVNAYQQNLTSVGTPKSWQERCREIDDVIEQNQFDRLRDQIPLAITESIDGIQRVKHIVRAMKEFSHPGGGERIPSDLNRAIESTVTITRNRWKYVAELELDLDPDMPSVWCFPADMNQVFLNLIVNAADAIADKVGDGGETMGRITVRSRAAGDKVVIEVEDSGCGIPEPIRNRIFDPFFTTKDVGKGTGQGLAICYNAVVNKHDGSLTVESTPGVGSLFRITVPVAPASPVNPEERHAAAVPTADRQQVTIS